MLPVPRPLATDDRLRAGRRSYPRDRRQARLCGWLAACWSAGRRPVNGPEVSEDRPDGRYGVRLMTRILLVRHGESEWNAAGRWQGQADPPLSDQGRAQAVSAAASIGSVDAVVTSDLERAAHTGTIIARNLGVDHVATDPGLRERDAGQLSGLTRAQIYERFPGLLPDDPGGFKPGPDGDPEWPEGWEHDDHLWPRVEVALQAIGQLVPHGDVLVVTHGGVMYAVEKRLGSPGRGRLANLDAFEVDLVDGKFRLGERHSLVDPSDTISIERDQI